MNILTPIAVVEVNPEPSDFLKSRGSYKTSNAPRAHYINTHSHKMKGSFETTPKKLEFQNLREKLT